MTPDELAARRQALDDAAKAICHRLCGGSSPDAPSLTLNRRWSNCTKEFWWAHGEFIECKADPIHEMIRREDSGKPISLPTGPCAPATDRSSGGESD